MATTWDWSPVVQAFGGFMQEQQQKRQLDQVLQSLLSPEGATTPAPQPAQGLIGRLLNPQARQQPQQSPLAQAQPMQPMNPEDMTGDQVQPQNMVGMRAAPQTAQGGGLKELIGRVMGGLGAQGGAVGQPSLAGGGGSDALRGGSPLGGIDPRMADLLRKLPPSIAMPLLLQTMQSQLTPKAHTFASTRDGQIYDTSTGQLSGTSVAQRDADALKAQNAAEANQIGGTMDTGNIGAIDQLPLEGGQREALRNLVQTGGAKGIETYRDVVKGLATKGEGGGITTKEVNIGDQTKIGQFKDGQLIGFAKDPQGNEITAPRYKPTAAVGDTSVIDTPPDPESGSILAQTGLSLPAYLALTDRTSSLPRDAATRKQAFAEAQSFANKRGVDVSTLASQFKANNKTLESNIERVNMTQNMEGELAGTLQNLKPIADAAAAGRLRIANVGKLFAGQEVNDPIVQQYAFYLNQLRSELAGYNGALQGRQGSSLNQQDYNEAERVIKNGLSAKGAEGLETAVAASTKKMQGVLAQSVDRSRKAVWDLFGVGEHYKPKYAVPPPPTGGASNGWGNFRQNP